MVDFLSKQKRSSVMARVKRQDTRPELSLRRALHACGLRYRLHVTSLPGSPDLVFSKYKAVVFVHGCFWHRHPGCRRASTPSTNMDFWSKKFERNVARDVRVATDLVAAGWNVFTVWECELSSKSKIETIAKYLKSVITLDSLPTSSYGKASV